MIGNASIFLMKITDATDNNSYRKTNSSERESRQKRFGNICQAKADEANLDDGQKSGLDPPERTTVLRSVLFLSLFYFFFSLLGDNLGEFV